MKHFNLQKTVSVLMVVTTAVSLCSCSVTKSETGSCNVRAAVMTAAGVKDETYDQLVNGVMANIEVDKILPDADINGYDIIYLDDTIDDSGLFNTDLITEYVYNGGTIVLDNSLAPLFPSELLGAAELVQLTGCPVDMMFPNTNDELIDISEIIYDYSFILKGYTNYAKYESFNYGYGIVPSTAEIIAEKDGVGVYTLNRYGSGNVFFTNPMLPDDYGVSYLTESENGEPLAFSTSGAENILRSFFARYVSHQKYGFSVERTFGSHATRPAAWELHYEDINGVASDALQAFSKLCMEKGQMPSYTTARNIYTWFKRAESITYLKGDENGVFKTDPYEGVYCSGTHVVSAGKWLELDSYEDTDSYFEDNTMYVKRAYPAPCDFNSDGRLDFICGSADGRFYYFEGIGMKTNYETSVATMLTDYEGNALNVGAYSSPTLFDIDGDGLDEIISGSEGGTVYAFHTLRNEENPSSLAFEPTGVVLDTGLPDSMVSGGDLNGDGITDLAIGSRTGEMRVYYGFCEDGYNIKYSDHVTVETQQQWVSPCIYNGELYGGTLEGYVAHYKNNGTAYVLDTYLETDDVSRRGNSRISIGMNSVPRFADIDGDGSDDLVCGSLEYGMAYPIDSEYFPFKDKLKEQFDFCNEYNIYMGVHGFTHKYATPEHEKRELDYHKQAFDNLGLAWEDMGANQHTWFTSKYGYDGSNMDGYNPNYSGSFDMQYESGLLWNNGSTLPESAAVPQDCAENAIPMPMYMPDSDFLLLETSNTPHGDGGYSYMSVKYDMPMLFYNHCDYIYRRTEEQYEAIDKVDELVDTYDYVFVTEKQMAMAVSAAYNTQISARVNGSDIIVTGTVRDKNRGLYNEAYTNSVGVRIVFANDVNGDSYVPDSAVWTRGENCIYTSLGDGITLKNNMINDNIHIKQVNIPADISVGRGANVKFKDSGLMYVRVEGEADTPSPDWTVIKRNGDTIFMKFGKAQTLKIER